MIHFGIIHAVHRSRHTLTDCIAALHAAGCNDPQVFSDRGEYGALRNLIRALSSMLRSRGLSGADAPHYFCVVDDDLVVCLEALRIVKERIDKDAPDALTMYTVEQNLPHAIRDQRGWVEAPVSVNTWGGMVVIRQDVAVEVLVDLCDIAEMRPYLAKCPDSALYLALERLHVPVLHHIPSLTQDIGDGASTLGNEHTPETKGYKFEQWG